MLFFRRSWSIGAPALRSTSVTMRPISPRTLPLVEDSLMEAMNWRAARALLKRLQPGDRVAIWAPNSAHWIILQQGISLAGMILVAANPAYRSRELEHILSNSAAAGLFYVDSYRGLDLAAVV